MCAHGAIWREHFFHRAGRKVHASLSHYGVHHLACAHKRRAARGIITQAGATNAVFILFVALLSGFFVFVNKVKVADRNVGQIKDVERLGQIFVELAVFPRAFEFVGHTHNCAAIRRFNHVLVFDLGSLDFHFLLKLVVQFINYNTVVFSVVF